MKNLEEKNTGKKVTKEVVEFVRFLEDVRDLTNENAHTGARIAIADYLGYVKFYNIFTRIQEIQDIEGHLPEGLSFYRDETTNEMLNAISVEYGVYIRDIIYEIGL